MKKGYFGWYMVVIATMANIVLVGINFSSFGLYVVPVSDELGLSRADMNTAMILLNMGVAITAPFAGRLLDRLSLKQVLITSSIAVGACLAGLSLSRFFWLSGLILFLPLPFALQMAGLLSMSVLLVRWLHGLMYTEAVPLRWVWWECLWEGF